MLVLKISLLYCSPGEPKWIFSSLKRPEDILHSILFYAERRHVLPAVPSDNNLPAVASPESNRMDQAVSLPLVVMVAVSSHKTIMAYL